MLLYLEVLIKLALSNLAWVTLLSERKSHNDSWLMIVLLATGTCYNCDTALQLIELATTMKIDLYASE